MSDFPNEATFLYERRGNVPHVKTKGITNHELRVILVGFWLTLDEYDRRDHVAELRHYLDVPGSYPPPASVELAQAVLAARNPNPGD